MRILRRVLEQIAGHARRCLPEECCGILLSRPEAPDKVTAALEALNADAGSRHSAYVLGHRAHIRAVALEAAGDARIAGYYHSHPAGGTRPSGRDAARSVEHAVYLIAGVQEGGV